MIGYVITHIRRDMKNSLAALLSYFAVLALLLSVQQATQSRQNALDAMISSMEIRCTVSDGYGVETDGLGITELNYLPLFDDGVLAEYVCDVRMSAFFTANVSFSNCALKAITSDQAVQELLSAPIAYDAGIDQTMWQNNEKWCVISTDLLNDTYIGEDGHRYIDVLGRFDAPDPEKDISEYRVNIPLTFRVVGTAAVKSSVYCPFNMLRNLCQAQNPSITFWADGCSFRVRDNHRLSELRSALRGFFAEASYSNPSSLHPHAVMIHDDLYLKQTQAAQKNLAIMQLMQPILYLCALGAGVMLVVMQMRGRKKEMAVIRSLGAGRLRVMAQSILEYALICLAVTLFALLVWRELSPMTVLGVWMAFMAGALCTIVRFSMIPLVKQIRELEE